jgi:hypothetical protein
MERDASVVVEVPGIEPWQSAGRPEGAEERRNDLAPVGVSGEDEVESLRHRVHEVGRMRDHDPVVSSWTRAHEPCEPRRIALAAMIA